LAIVQEYMEGGSLYQLLQLQEQLGDSAGLLYTREEALQWLVEVGQALRYLHEQKPQIIHRWVGGLWNPIRYSTDNAAMLF
jgi:serine/threonine protein kinase